MELMGYFGCCNFIQYCQLSQIVFRCFDTDSDNFIGFDEYIKVMSVFLKGRYEEKLKCKKGVLTRL